MASEPYLVTFTYTMQVEAEDFNEAEELAWEKFCEETEPSNFHLSRMENEVCIVNYPEPDEETQ